MLETLEVTKTREFIKGLFCSTVNKPDSLHIGGMHKKLSWKFLLSDKALPATTGRLLEALALGGEFSSREGRDNALVLMGKKRLPTQVQTSFSNLSHF